MSKIEYFTELKEILSTIKNAKPNRSPINILIKPHRKTLIHKNLFTPISFKPLEEITSELLFSRAARSRNCAARIRSIAKIKEKPNRNLSFGGMYDNRRKYNPLTNERIVEKCKLDLTTLRDSFAEEQRTRHCSYYVSSLNKSPYDKYKKVRIVLPPIR